MGANNSRVEGLCRPAQSGKTKTYQQLIKDYEMLADLFYECEGFVNFVICSNNKSLVQQTTARHATDLYESSSVESDDGIADDRIEGKVFSWFSGTKENNISVRDLADRIKEDEVGMVVCCAHAKRIGFLAQLLEQLNRSKNFKRKVNIWIDEADESINKWSKIDIASLPVVHSVTLISATFDAIVKKYGKVRVRCYDVAHPATYVGFKDCDVTRKDIAVASAPAYAAAVYDEFSAQLCVPGLRLFAPGDTTRESHDQIAEFLRMRGWAVLVLNGARKEIVKPDGQILPIADYVEWDNGTPEEIGKTITSIYHDSGLGQFPFAITGQICLGRGLTFQNDRFLFDWAIVPNMADRATAYQCAARVLGNIKHLPNYKQCKIITTSRMQRLIEQAENIAINIGRGEKGDHVFVDRETLKRAQVSDIARQHEANVKLEEFASMDKLISRWTAIAASLPMCKAGRAPNVPQKDATGKFKCSLGNVSGVQSSADVRAFAGKGTGGWGAGLTEAVAGELIKRVYAGYDGEVPTFFLRWTYSVS